MAFQYFHIIVADIVKTALVTYGDKCICAMDLATMVTCDATGQKIFNGSVPAAIPMDHCTLQLLSEVRNTTYIFNRLFNIPCNIGPNADMAWLNNTAIVNTHTDVMAVTIELPLVWRQLLGMKTATPIWLTLADKYHDTAPSDTNRDNFAHGYDPAADKRWRADVSWSKPSSILLECVDEKMIDILMHSPIKVNCYFSIFTRPMPT